MDEDPVELEIQKFFSENDLKTDLKSLETHTSENLNFQDNADSNIDNNMSYSDVLSLIDNLISSSKFREELNVDEFLIFQRVRDCIALKNELM